MSNTEKQIKEIRRNIRVLIGQPPSLFFVFYPDDFGVGLVGVYVGATVVLEILYPFCKCVAQVKKTRTDW